MWHPLHQQPNNQPPKLQQTHSVCAMPLSLEQLPQAWLLQFIDLLPNRLRLSLRQCSLWMLQLVDSHSSSCLAWRVLATSRIAVAAQLCAGNVRHLDTSQLPANLTGGLMQAISHRAPVTESTADAPQLCRRVQKVTGRKDQLGSIICAAAASTAAGRLEELSVWCCSDCAGAPATPVPDPLVADDGECRSFFSSPVHSTYCQEPPRMVC